tara:strand:+ start:61 stop:486 length:426 start_codon:yes stop_codon:yes gene_type:complete
MPNLNRITFLSIVFVQFSVTSVSAFDLQRVLPICCNEMNGSSVQGFSLQQDPGIRHSVPSEKYFRSSVFFSSALTVVGGIVAYLNKKQADRTYRSYLRTANSSKLESEFKRAERLDKFAGSALITMEIGIGMTTYLIFFRE